MQTVRFAAISHTRYHECDHTGDQSGRYVRAEVAERLLAFVQRVAYDPIGHAEASDREILDQLTDEARTIIDAESTAPVPEDTNPPGTLRH